MPWGPHSALYYQEMYERSYASALQTKPRTARLLAIRELMSFYCKKSEKFFSDLHHVMTVKCIISCIDHHLERQSESKYENCIRSIEKRIRNAEEYYGFNFEGDFANIHRCLIQKIPGFIAFPEVEEKFISSIKRPFSTIHSIKHYPPAFFIEQKSIYPSTHPHHDSHPHHQGRRHDDSRPHHQGRNHDDSRPHRQDHYHNYSYLQNQHTHDTSDNSHTTDHTQISEHTDSSGHDSGSHGGHSP